MNSVVIDGVTYRPEAKSSEVRIVILVHRPIANVCTGNALTTREFWGGVAREMGMGPKDVAMCIPCATASDAVPTSARTAAPS